MIPFINYEALNNNYSSEKMHENIRRLKDYDSFHCLLASNSKTVNSIKNLITDLPQEFIKWLNICNGGMLFDTTMLSTESYDAKLDLPFDTYNEYLDSKFRKDNQLSDGWFIFAVAIHSDLFFFDTDKKDAKVYQWDVEELKIHTIWETFEDWLTDQINEAIELIAKEKLEPLDIKL